MFTWFSSPSSKGTLDRTHPGGGSVSVSDRKNTFEAMNSESQLARWVNISDISGSAPD